MNYPAGSDNSLAPWNAEVDADFCDDCGETESLFYSQEVYDHTVHNYVPRNRCEDCVERCNFPVAGCREIRMNGFTFCYEHEVQATKEQIADAVRDGDAEMVKLYSEDLAKVYATRQETRKAA